MPSSSSSPPARRRSKRTKKSAAATSTGTLFYCLGLYLAYSIFTREDDPNPYAIGNPSTSHYHEQPHHPSTPNYGYPNLHLPNLHLPSPISTTTITSIPQIPLPAAPPSSGFLRLLVTFATWPFIMLFNILAFIFHYVSATLILLLIAAHYLASPALEALSILSRTFLFPFRLLGNTMSLLYPVYKLVGGLMGVGATMGLTIGWIGKASEKRIYASARAKRVRREQEKQDDEDFGVFNSDYSQSTPTNRYRSTPAAPSTRLSRRSSSSATVRPIHIYSAASQPVPQRERRSKSQRISFAEPPSSSEDRDDDGGRELHLHIYPAGEGSGSGNDRVKDGEVVGLRRRGRILGQR